MGKWGRLDFKKYLGSKQALVEKHLVGLFDKSVPKKLAEAMTYSLTAGGKRVRPALVLMTDDLLAGKLQPRHSSDMIRIATALECIHTYSLIHDDLPAMDDDQLRRGKPTCHVRYGEATAILAGDGLLTFAFELIGRLEKNRASALDLVLALSKNAGVSGMVGGQELDIENEGKPLALKELQTIHQMKTGALLLASVLMPAIYRGKKSALPHLTVYGQQIGVAFQIADDVLDASSTTEKLGKSAGSDARNQKITYVTHLGLDGARKAARVAADKAKTALKKVPGPKEHLLALADYIVSREN